MEGCERRHKAKGLYRKHYDALPMCRAKKIIYRDARLKTDPTFKAKHNTRIHACDAKRRKTDPTYRARRNASNVASYTKRRRVDPFFRFKEGVRISIRNSFKQRGFGRGSRTEQILGCAYEEAKTHIEAKFKPGWTWENRGVVWDIDHIVPLATAKTRDDVVRLWHHANLQPLECHINRNIKKAKLGWNPT